MAYSIVIPARMASSRLPGKVLQDIAGKPMLQHVFEFAQSTGAEMVCIATDSTQVADVARGFGATVCMTSSEHATGSERVAEAVDSLHFEDQDIVLCLQADEPQMPRSVVEALAAAMEKNDTIKVATPCQRITQAAELFDPSVVKVVMNERNNASYFSRAPIPWNRDQFQHGTPPAQVQGDYFRHIGLYAYRVDFLNKFLSWESAPTESVESLEQLRILWNGGKIHMVEVEDSVPCGVDTPADLERVRAAFACAV
jgi:3-deoxy-manno-octulosonate cytidylyltransferase (CMP-KDO synthetase)